jgi:hypothetical protein
LAKLPTKPPAVAAGCEPACKFAPVFGVIGVQF